MEFIRVLFRSNRAWRDGTPEQAERLAEPIGLLAERVLRQRHRAVLKAGRGYATLTEDERHAVRIALKKLRYAVGFFQTLLSGRRVRAYGQAVKRLQTDLGRVNDRAVAQRLLAPLPIAARSEERRAGKQCSSRCRSWWPRSQYKNK